MCLLQNFITFEAARYKISSNIIEVIRSVLNFLFIFFNFFLQKDFIKKHKTAYSEQK